MKLGSIGRDYDPEGFSRRPHSNLRTIPRQLSLREAEIFSSSFQTSVSPRRHNSDEAITRPRRVKSTNSSDETVSNSRMPTHRLPSQRFRRECSAEEINYSREHSTKQHIIPQDFSPKKPSRSVSHQYYRNRGEGNARSNYSRNDDNDHHTDDQIDDEFVETSRFSHRLSGLDDRRCKHPVRSSSCRHFGADPTLNQIPSEVHQPRRLPAFTRSLSEHSIGGYHFRNGEKVSHNKYEYRNQKCGEEEEDQPRQRYLPTDNISVSLSHNRAHSAHVRAPAPAMSRGPSRRSLRAQNSLQSISESGDALSDLTGERSSNKTPNEEAPDEKEEPASPLHGTDESSSNSIIHFDISSRRTLRTLSYGRLEKAVEIAPGIYMRLRDANETWDAIEQGNFVSASCGQCEQDTIYCIDSASFVSCPRCKHITAIKGQSESGGGVGLGFTPSMFKACNLVGSRFVSNSEKRDRRRQGRSQPDR